MPLKRTLFVLLALLLLSNLSLRADAQARRAYRLTDAQMRQLLRRIESDTARFRRSAGEALGSSSADEVNALISAFEEAMASLRDRFGRRESARGDAEVVLDRAARIDDYVRQHRLSVRAESDWRTLRADLNQLARAYGITWRWNASTAANAPAVGVDARLTGTYELDAERSQNPREAIEQVTRSLPSGQRQSVYDELVARLDPPDRLAVERRGRAVTIASSRAPRISLIADGIERSERANDGSAMRVRASLIGDRLEINAVGERGSSFNVTFEALDNGDRLRVVRRIYADRIGQYVSLESIYDRVSSVAQWDLYRETSPVTSEAFLVPDGTRVVAVLNTNLSTKDSREGDRFTATVREPTNYRDAVIEGYVSRVNQPGRISGRAEITLNFERIRLPDGRSYRFSGILESVQPVGGEQVRIDNEGAIKEQTSQTERTVQRTAIGTAVGAVIGAIAGGGKGAAIGAVIGAGAGAGSVYVQGRDHLELASGTALTIRASAPR